MLDIVIALLAVGVVKSTPLVFGALSGIVSERIVDLFEAVQVEKRNGQLTIVATRL